MGLYRLIFVWGWFAHTLGQITHNFGPYLEKVGVSPGFVWKAYWKLGPYLYGFWYIAKFMASDEAHLSPSVLTFWFGRWMWSWNCPNEHQWDLNRILPFCFCYSQRFSCVTTSCEPCG